MDFASNTLSIISTFLDRVLFFNVLFFSKQNLPFLIFWLMLASFWSIWNLRGFFFNYLLCGFKTIASKSLYNKQLIKIKSLNNSSGNFSDSRKILLTSIGSNIDLSSIVGVSLVVSLVGPGVIFWMLVSGVFLSSLRFIEAYYSHLTRNLFLEKNGDKNVIGGPVVYMKYAFKNKKIAAFFVSFFSISLIFSTFFSPQINQTVQVISYFNKNLENYIWLLSFAISLSIIIIIKFGVKMIFDFASYIVKIMIFLYLVVAIMVIFRNISNFSNAISMIVSDAFTASSGISGSVLVLVIYGIKRAAFCSEVGMGSVVMLHTHSVNKNSTLEGKVAMISPIISITLVAICSGFVVVISGSFLTSKSGIEIMSNALSTVFPGLEYVLLLIIPLFGISTSLSWGYYGYQSWKGFFGAKNSSIYLFLLFGCYFVCGMVKDFIVILGLADIVNISISIPNIIALYFLVKKIPIKHNKKDKDGEFID